SGGVIWASIYGFGYFYAASVVKRLNSALAIVAIALGVALVEAVVLFIRRNMAEWEERAERALPGPLG
ncbi:MAG TPA: hypothetical protein VFL87_10865, partial [Thermoleophilaceae bacterium]|nr:hypothetical protein [Thermoleophilaceae bacterium]